MTAPGSGIPTSCRFEAEVFDRLMPRPTSSPRREGTCRVGQKEISKSRRDPHRSGLAREHTCRQCSLSSVGCRPRRGAAFFVQLWRMPTPAEIQPARRSGRTSISGRRSDDGSKATKDSLRARLRKMERVKGEIGAKRSRRPLSRGDRAPFRNLSTATALSPFWTLPAYRCCDETADAPTCPVVVSTRRD